MRETDPWERSAAFMMLEPPKARIDFSQLQSEVRQALAIVRGAVESPSPAIADLERQIAELREEFHRHIRDEIDHSRAPLPLDPIEVWIRSNWKLLKEHAGEIVAIHPLEGIVASGPDYASVAAQVRQKGRENSVVIRFVRRN